MESALADQPQEAELILSRGITVTGTAICADGKPAAGWGIAAVPAWSRSNYSSKAATIDSSGHFSLEHVMAEKYLLNIAKHGSEQSLGEYTLPAAGAGTLHLAVPGPSPVGLFAITGKIHCDGPISDGMILEVRGSNANSGFYQSTLAHQGGNWSDDEKKHGALFSISDIPAGTYELTFECTDIGSVKVNHVVVPGQPLSVNLKILQKPRLTGTVTDPSGQPVARFAVRLRKIQELGSGPNYGQDSNWIQVDDSDGRFNIELVGPGVYQAQVSAPGYAWAWSADVKAEEMGDAVDTSVQLTEGATLQGSVVDTAGRPVRGAKVIPLSMSADMNLRNGGFAGDAGSAMTDAQGRFVLSHLPPGDESIKIVNPDCAPLIVSNLKTVDGKTTDVAPAVIRSGGSVEGTVYDSKGNVASDVVIDFQNDNEYHYMRGELTSHLLASATTDSAGHFRVDHLPPGQEITVMKSYDAPGGQEGVVRRTVNAIDGQTLRLDFGGTAPVRGRLLVAGKPAPGIRLTLSVGDPSFGSTLIYANTDAEGKFAVFGPPPDDYILSRENADSFNRQLLLGDFKLTQPPRDIGDVIQDTGKVVIQLNASDAVNVRDMQIDNRDAAVWWKKTICSANADDKNPGTWTATAVPPGRLAVSIYVKGEVYRQVHVPFDRKAGEIATSVTVPPFPKPTAILTTQAGSADDRNAHWITIRSDDGVNELPVSDAASSPREIAVPPGNYFVVDGGTDGPRGDLPMIKAMAGQKTMVDVVGFSAGTKSKSKMQTDECRG